MHILIDATIQTDCTHNDCNLEILATILMIHCERIKIMDHRKGEYTHEINAEADDKKLYAKIEIIP